MKAFLLLSSLIFLANCKVIRLPARVKVDKDIVGICDSKANPCNQKNNFIIMHGIGSQENNYSKNIIDRLNDFTFGKSNYRYKIAVLKGSEFVDMANYTLQDVYNTYYNDGEIEVIKIIAEELGVSKNEKRNVFYSINWSVVSNQRKEELEINEFRHSPYYFGFNKLIKRQLMIRRMSDAFSGSQPKLAENIYKTFYTIVENGEILKKENGTLNVITGSFGTQLFLGAINELQKNSSSSYFGSLINLFDENEKAAFPDEFIKKVKIDSKLDLKLFALSNQINLMPDNISSWFGNINSNSSKLNFNSVQLVAFRNPNDILCYYLPEKVGKSFFPDSIHGAVNVINTYYFNWPFRNDMASAHTAVFKLKKLAKIIYYGSNSKWVKKKTSL